GVGVQLDADGGQVALVRARVPGLLVRVHDAVDGAAGDDVVRRGPGLRVAQPVDDAADLLARGGPPPVGGDGLDLVALAGAPVRGGAVGDELVGASHRSPSRSRWARRGAPARSTRAPQ